MSQELLEIPTKRWTAKRKSSLVMLLIKGEISISEASRQYDLPQSEIESWRLEALSGMENALIAKPKDVKAQYESKIQELHSIR